MTNLFLPSRYDERVYRLALGLEPRDAVRAQRIARPLEVTLDGAPIGEENAAGDLFGLDRATVGLRRVATRSGGRFALLTTDHGAAGPDIALRLHDRRRCFVSRRIRYPVPIDPTVRAPRVREPFVFPGAAYDVSETATGLRGRVVWGPLPDQTPVRWARIEATVDGASVGRAHGDDRGEFLLLLEPAAGGIGDLRVPLTARVTVFAPPAPPIPSDPILARRDPLWDLPLEVLTGLGDPDDVSTGERLPAGYVSTASSTRVVTFEPGRLGSEEPTFVLLP
jgi:hypothetical protein